MSFVSKFTLCVYCGASNAVDDGFKNLAVTVGTELGRRGMRLVYGGGHVGLMGLTADSALKAGAEVIGIIPEHIRAQEVQHDGLTKLHVVPDMHTRKRMMAEHADAFVILPGGLGTLDEVFEIITWKKLSLHNKPIVIYNHDGYWDNFLRLIDDLVTHKFANAADRALYSVVTTIDDLFKAVDTTGLPQRATNTGRM